MNRQEKINADMQRQLAMQDAKFSMFVEEMRDFKNEMRQQNQMRAEEIRQINLRIDEKFNAIDEKFNAIDDKFDKLSSQINSLTIAAVVGVGAIMATIGGIIIAVIK